MKKGPLTKGPLSFNYGIRKNMTEQFKYKGFKIIRDENGHYVLYRTGKRKHHNGIYYKGTYYQDFIGIQKDYRENILNLIYNYIDAIYDGTAIPIYCGDPLLTRC